MKRPFKTGSKTISRLSKDASRLVNTCIAAVDSASHAEEQYWFAVIETMVSALMDRGNDIAIEAALEHTHQLNAAAHEILAASCEAAAESCHYNIDINDGVLTRHALLISIPIIAWSKYQIPAGLLSEQAIAPIRAQLHGHILSHDVSLCLNPFLYSIDHLPRGFSDTRKLVKTMADATRNDAPATIDYSKLGVAAELLADVRFILG
ncbi:MAG: DUF2863 family protein, partial [Pseudomonadota bacterium]